MTGIACIMFNSSYSLLQVSAPNILKIAAIGVTAVDTSTAVVTGGSGSYAYAWTPTGAGINYTGTSTATLGASKASTAAGAADGSATLLVTDSVTGQTASTSITVHLENTA